MPSIHPEDLTPFGRAALKLDREFAELARVGEQMARVDVESDGGLAEGIRILNRAAQHGEGLAAVMQDFSASLQEARGQAEAAMKLVGERAQLIRARRRQQDQLQERLTRLREDMKTAGAGLAGFSPPEKSGLSEADKRRIAAELERLQEPMNRFIAAAREIKAEAARSRFKRLERQADSMIDSLQASCRRIAQALESK
jgi:hypothetical protein